MKRLTWYIGKNLLIALLLTIAIGTFVMLIGSFARLFDLLSRGVPLHLLLVAVLLRLPQLLAYTLPLGVLVSTVLVFSRMSADHEITALRSSGISLLQLATPAVILNAIVCALCLFLQLYLAPEFLQRARVFLPQAAATAPLTLLEPRVFNEVQKGFLIYFSSRDGDVLRDVHLCRLDEQHRVQQDILAETGQLQVNEERQELVLTLRKVIVTSGDPAAPEAADKLNRMVADSLTYPLAYGEELNQRSLVRRPGCMTVAQLLAYICLNESLGANTTSLQMELHMRLALALAPFSFLLAGMALGLRLGRRESSSGLFGCVGVGLAYYGFVTYVETLCSRPGLHPQLLVWLPNLFCQAGGLWGLWRRR